MVGSLSQFGPSSKVSRKISWLITPHSGLSMKRSDMMVGIDGTAQGRMNSTESHLIQVRVLDEESRQQQRDHHLQIDRDDQEHERVDDRAREDRIVEQMRVGLAGGARPRSRSRSDRARRKGRRAHRARSGSCPRPATASSTPRSACGRWRSGASVIVVMPIYLKVPGRVRGRGSVGVSRRPA